MRASSSRVRQRHRPSCWIGTDGDSIHAFEPRRRRQRLEPLRARAGSSVSSSRRWRPVSDTKTSSRLTCRVVSRTSGRSGRLELVEQGRDRPVRLGRRSGRSRPPRRGRRGPVARPLKLDGLGGGSSPASANSTMCSPPSRAISSRGRAQRDDLALVDDRHPVAEPLGLVHVVGRQHGRPAPRRGGRGSRPRAAGATAGRGPVVGSSRKSSSGSPTRRQRHRQPLLLAAGELLDERVGLALQRDPRQHVVGLDSPRGRSCGRAGRIS